MLCDFAADQPFESRYSRVDFTKKLQALLAASYPENSVYSNHLNGRRLFAILRLQSSSFALYGKILLLHIAGRRKPLRGVGAARIQRCVRHLFYPASQSITPDVSGMPDINRCGLKIADIAPDTEEQR